MNKECTLNEDPVPRVQGTIQAYTNGGGLTKEEDYLNFIPYLIILDLKVL